MKNSKKTPYLLILITLSLTFSINALPPQLTLIHNKLIALKKTGTVRLQDLMKHGNGLLAHTPFASNFINSIKSLKVMDIAIIANEPRNEIFIDGIVNAFDQPTYCAAYLGLRDEGDISLTIYVIPLHELSINFGHLHKSLRSLDTVAALSAPVVIVSSHATTRDHLGYGRVSNGVTLAGYMRPRGKLYDFVSGFGLQALMCSASLPFELDSIADFGLSIKAILHKTIAHTLTFDELGVQIGMSEQLLPNLKTVLRSTVRFPNCMPLRCSMHGSINSLANISLQGSVLGKLDMPFGVPLSMGNVAGRFDFRISENGIIPTAIGANGMAGFTMPPQPPRELELGALINFPAISPATFQGTLSYLSASDLYNFFPYMITRIPLIHSHIKDALEQETRNYYNTQRKIEEQTALYKKQLNSLQLIQGRVAMRLNNLPANNSLVQAQQEIHDHIDRCALTEAELTEQSTHDKNQLKETLEQIERIAEKAVKVSPLISKIIGAKLPDFFALKDVEVRIAPMPVSLGDYRIKQGVIFKGTLLLPHLNTILQDGALVDATPCDAKEVSVEFGVSPQGIVGGGRMSPINLMVGDQSLLKMCDSKNCEQGPYVDMALTLQKQQLVLKGHVSVLNVLSADTDIVFGLTEAHCSLSGDFHGLHADFACNAPLTDLSAWTIEANLADGLTERVKLFLKENIVHNNMIKKILDSFAIYEAGFKASLADMRHGVLPAIRLKGKIFGKKFSLNLKDIALPMRDQDILPLVEPIIDEMRRMHPGIFDAEVL